MVSLPLPARRLPSQRREAEVFHPRLSLAQGEGRAGAGGYLDARQGTEASHRSPKKSKPAGWVIWSSAFMPAF